MAARSFKYLFITEFQRLLSIELQVSEALPALQIAASTEELTEAIHSCSERAKQAASRIKSASIRFGDGAKLRPEAAGKAMLQACLACPKRYPKSNVRDAALLTSLERLTGYRVAVYASTLALAQQLGEATIAKFLKEAFIVEELAAKNFAQIALQVNAEAFADTHSEQCLPSVP